MQPKRGSYTAQFKVQVLSHQDGEQRSSRRVAAICDVGNPNQVVVWQRAFDDGGVAALEDRRQAHQMKVDSSGPKTTDTEDAGSHRALLKLACLSRSTFYYQAKVSWLHGSDGRRQQRSAQANLHRRFAALPWETQ